MRAGVVFSAVVLLCAVGRAEVGDPQVKTDHPWYPGELSCSTFERLFATQAALYKRVTGRDVSTDEDKALASWYWRNLNYAHGEEGRCDWFGEKKGPESEQNRDYWVGLFAHGFGLCGTTHAQYTAEINELLGHCRGRCVGVEGHNSFEVFLTGGAYGSGRWALLDHDISTVIFSEDGNRLLSIAEIVPQLAKLKDPKFRPQRQRNWRVAGLHDGDAATYSTFKSVEYLAGYAGPPPMIQLRRGESVKRFLEPGLEDGKTFVFWGRNYRTGGVPGPERSRTWVNQPEKMYGSKNGTGYRAGQVRFANAVYEYRPNFSGGTYKEGVVEESDDRVIFSFRAPFMIGCTPANERDWGIYEEGGKNGLVVSGKADVPVAVSVDRGKTWISGGASYPVDLTDTVKGYQQYWLRFDAPAGKLKDAGLSWRTVCQTNVATIPHLKDGANRITFAASGLGLVSAGPTKQQALAHVVAGKFEAGDVTLELSPPKGMKAARVYAASWQASGNPPSASKYRIDYSIDGGKTWRDVVKDWSILRREPEPKDFWSQSFCWGDAAVESNGSVRVRFSNSQKRGYRKVEAHLAYEVAQPSETLVTFAWREGSGQLKTASRTYQPKRGEDSSWTIETGKDVKTVWVEYAAK